MLSVLAHEMGHAMGFAHSEGGVMAEGLLPGQRVMPDRWFAPQTAAVALAAVLEFGTASVAVPQIDWGVRAAKPEVPRPLVASPTAQRSASSEWQTRFVNHLGATPDRLSPNAALRLHVDARVRVTPSVSSFE